VRRAAGAILAIALFAATNASAETYRDDQNYVTVEIPAGWTVMSEDAVGEIGQSIGTTYSIGFEPRGRKPHEYPYVVGRMIPRLQPFASWEEVKRDAAARTDERVKDAKQKLGQMLVRVDVDPIVIERDKKRVVVRTRVVLRDRAISGYTVGVVGQNGIYYLGGTARSEDAARLQKDVDAFGFRWDPAVEWKSPAAKQPSRLVDWALPPAIVLAIFAAGVALTKRRTAS
jgi:hypothetical protein